MRKSNGFKLLVLIVAFSLAFATACTPVSDSQEVQDEGNAGDNGVSLNDYYPFIHDSVYEYEGRGNEFAEQSVFLEYENGQRGQYRNINPGTETVRIVERTADSVREIYLEGEFYHTENILSTSGVKNNILLKEPLEKGNSWELEEGYIREITGLDVMIETPYGTFNALEVTTYLDEDRLQKNYYAKDIGMVAVLYFDGEIEISSLLSDIIEGPYEKDIRLYYPLESDNEITISYVDHIFNFTTNDQLENIFEDLFKNPVEEGLTRVISQDTMINSVFLDKGTWTVKVDFTSELIPGWNAGSYLEWMLINSIVNTFGEFYDTDKVYISIDGVPFTSGHFELPENEVFEVDTEGIEEYD